MIDRPGIESELSRITAPTVVLVGDEDVATPIAKAKQIIAGIAGARLVQISHAGHSSTVEQPAAVTAALESFLAALPAVRQVV